MRTRLCNGRKKKNAPPRASRIKCVACQPSRVSASSFCWLAAPRRLSPRRGHGSVVVLLLSVGPPSCSPIAQRSSKPSAPPPRSLQCANAEGTSCRSRRHARWSAGLKLCARSAASISSGARSRYANYRIGMASCRQTLARPFGTRPQPRRWWRPSISWEMTTPWQPECCCTGRAAIRLDRLVVVSRQRLSALVVGGWVGSVTRGWVCVRLRLIALAPATYRHQGRGTRSGRAAE